MSHIVSVLIKIICTEKREETEMVGTERLEVEINGAEEQHGQFRGIACLDSCLIPLLALE